MKVGILTRLLMHGFCKRHIRDSSFATIFKTHCFLNFLPCVIFFRVLRLYNFAWVPFRWTAVFNFFPPLAVDFDRLHSMDLSHTFGSGFRIRRNSVSVSHLGSSKRHWCKHLPVALFLDFCCFIQKSRRFLRLSFLPCIRAVLLNCRCYSLDSCALIFKRHSSGIS